MDNSHLICFIIFNIMKVNEFTQPFLSYLYLLSVPIYFFVERKYPLTEGTGFYRLKSCPIYLEAAVGQIYQRQSSASTVMGSTAAPNSIYHDAQEHMLYGRMLFRRLRRVLRQLSYLLRSQNRMADRCPSRVYSDTSPRSEMEYSACFARS